MDRQTHYLTRVLEELGKVRQEIRELRDLITQDDATTTVNEEKPDTTVVRGCYIALMRDSGESGAKARVEFDRWLDAVKAEAWDEGQYAWDDEGYDPANPYLKG